jgi:predicted Zn-dependent peptidase
MSHLCTVEELGPGISRAVLPNGIPVLAEHLPSVRSVSIGVWVQTGSRDEADDEGGLSHFLEHILFKGTQRRNAFQISYEVERRGGHLDAFTGRECTCFYARMLDRDLPVAVDVLSDIVSHPVFEAAQVEREKRVVLDEIAGVDDAPEDLIHDLLAENLWPEHPLGRPVLGTPSSIVELTPERIRAYWRRRYTADRMLVAVAGQFELDRLLDQLVGALDVPAPNGSAPRADRPLPPFAPTVRHEDRHLSQRHICMGTHGVPVVHPSCPSLLLLATLLGGGASSRLFQSVREEAGLAYSVFTYSEAYRDAGIFATSLSVHPDNADRAVDLVRTEYGRLRENGLTDGELEAARAQVTAAILLGLESTHDRMEHLAHCEIYRRRFVSADEQVRMVESATADDVHQRSEEYLDPARCTMVTLGPENGSDVENLGPSLRSPGRRARTLVTPGRSPLRRPPGERGCRARACRRASR